MLTQSFAAMCSSIIHHSSYILLALFPTFLRAQQAELPVPGHNLFVNRIAETQTIAPHLNGSGITVSIKEFGFDTSDVDLRGRVLPSPNAATNLTTHANIVAVLVGGAGNSDLRGRGAAPGCWLVSSSFVGLQPDADYLTQNITVQNHSYGMGIQNWYGPEAQAYDQTVVENNALLHVFSAGNSGDSLAIFGQYAGIPGFANLTGNLKMAKNALVVGAVDSLGQIGARSSHGPAHDGRIKPDLVAFGLDGTSGAAALVSGAAAVIQQGLKESSLGFHRSDLLRAILLNSTDDMGLPGPDFAHGFGNLNVKNAVQTLYNQQFTTEIITPGQTIALPLNLPGNIQKLQITLAWIDPAAPSLAPKALLHDLDLQLLDPLGQTHFPWVLNTAPHPDSLRQAARRGRDTLNNVEQVGIDFPTAGLWEIRVSAPPTLSGLPGIGFALAWDWELTEHFDWAYPTLNDPAPANTEVLLRWETNFPDTLARLEWRPWPSPDWRLISDSVPLQEGLRRWVLPDTFADAQLRMTVAGQQFLSQIFLISKELRVKIGFNCPDSVMLFWNSAHPAAQYQLYGLGEKHLQWLALLTDTFVVLQKSVFPQPRFAVLPVAAGQNTAGPRSPAPDISQQGVDCYFSNFLAEQNPTSAVDLTLEIGTTYGVDSMYFEKKQGKRFATINTQKVDNQTFIWTDEAPQQGANIYRTRLLLQNGAQLIGDTATVYRVAKDDWWVFPNPVSARGSLQVLTESEETPTFYLFDVLGKPVWEQVLDDTRVEILLPDCPKGIYFFQIGTAKSVLGSGRLMVD